MKKVAIIFGVVLVVLFLALLILPSIFKDDIKLAIDKAIAESVNADIVWDADDFSISLISNFPNASAKLSDIGVINRAPFEGDILFVSREISVEIDIFSLFGDQIKIKGIELNEPVINVIVDKDGNANYDIAIVDSTVVASDTASTSYNLGIDHWAIKNGTIVYRDETLPMLLEMKNFNHSGSGDFTQDEFDLNTNSTIDTLSVTYDNVSYLTNKQVSVDAVLNISNDFSTYTFKENTIAINDFKVGVDGFLSLLEDGFDMDLKLNAKDNSFKSILSLVPGMYTEDFNDISANGTLDFSAFAKGVYNDTRIPAFNVSIATKNSTFKYPDLPSAVENITIVASAQNNDGDLDNTTIDIPEFHMEFGKNPIDGRLLIENLKNYKMDGNLKASLDFSALTTIFPIDGMEVRGNGNVDLSFAGIYDSVRNIMPKINGDVAISNGYLKTSELPYALEKVEVKSHLENSTGEMKDFILQINPFSLLLDGAPFQADGEIRNFDNYAWNFNARGSLDLDKLAGLMQLENMELKGQLNADIHTRGNMLALDQERYQDLPTSGDITLRNFLYKSKDLPYDVVISDASATFDPEKMNLNRLKSTVGKSDFDVNGHVQNYIAYALGEGKVLKGNLNIKSNRIDLNEFMTDDSDAVETDSAMSVILVPENINFQVNAQAGEVLVTNMVLKNATGVVTLNNQTMTLDKLNFDMLGGEFVATGSYSTLNPQQPAYSFGIDVNKVSIAESFSTFEIVRNYVPVANLVTGSVSTNMKLSGKLLESMSPDLSTVNASGILNIDQASLKNSKIINSLAAVTALNTGDDINFKDLKMDVSIINGKLQVKPFDINIGEYNSTIQGTTSLDGAIAYEVDMLVPAGKMGAKLNSFLAQNEGNESDLVPITVGIGGTYNDPTSVLLLDEQKELLRAAIEEKGKEEVKEQAEELLKSVKDEKTRSVLEELLGTKEKDSLKSDSLATKEPAQNEKLKEEATDKIKDFFKKKNTKKDTTNSQ